jgi:phosphoserine aminotransferase
MPALRPRVPHFSSGPCAKRPGWTPQALAGALVGRSHRSAAGKARLRRAIDLTREVLQVPPDHRIAVVPASDTGAVEMALWSLLGARGVDVLAWESFGEGWVADVTRQLRLPDVRVLAAPYGRLPDLGRVDFSRDVVFTWNGTTSGVRVPDGDWIAEDRRGLTICDATSAAFAQALPFARLDVVTFSWQKALGGEAGHGMIVLGPRAVERLERHAPAWPLPKLFRLARDGRVDEALFRGETINTPSMLCVEDYLDALEWARSLGGLAALMARAEANLAAVAAWEAASTWATFLARDPATRSNTSVCLEVVAPAVVALAADARAAFVAAMAGLLEREGVAFDVLGHRDAPPNVRIWCGATVETSDVTALLPWLDWAFHEAARARSA